MTEKNYYKIFKKFEDGPILKYFSHLSFNDWIEFFDDYYTHNLTFLLRILETPKGENIYSYGLIIVNDIDANSKKLISRANDALLSRYIQENEVELLIEAFKAIRYLKLDIDRDLLIVIISNNNQKQGLRELAALTLIKINEYSSSSFWESLDLYKDQFLIPSYIAFFRKLNPVQGLNKLTIIQNEPENIIPFETPILYSLYQISLSVSDSIQFLDLKKYLPQWAISLIDYLFASYPELTDFKFKLKSIETHNLNSYKQNSLKIDWLEMVLDIAKNKRFLELTDEDWQFKIFAQYVESRNNEFNPNSVLTESETAYVILLSFVRDSTELYNRYTDIIVKLEVKYPEIVNISSVLFDVKVKKGEYYKIDSEPIVSEGGIMMYYENFKASHKEYKS